MDNRKARRRCKECDSLSRDVYDIAKGVHRDYKVIRDYIEFYDREINLFVKSHRIPDCVLGLRFHRSINMTMKGFLVYLNRGVCPYNPPVVPSWMKNWIGKYYEPIMSGNKPIKRFLRNYIHRGSAESLFNEFDYIKIRDIPNCRVKLTDIDELERLIRVLRAIRLDDNANTWRVDLIRRKKRSVCCRLIKENKGVRLHIEFRSLLQEDDRWLKRIRETLNDCPYSETKGLYTLPKIS